MRTSLASLVFLLANSLAQAGELAVKEYENVELHSCCIGEGNNQACTMCANQSAMKIRTLSKTDSSVEFNLRDENGSCSVKEEFTSIGNILRSKKLTGGIDSAST